jgi:hypothetical protein
MGPGGSFSATARTWAPDEDPQPHHAVGSLTERANQRIAALLPLASSGTHGGRDTRSVRAETSEVNAARMSNLFAQVTHALGVAGGEYV